MPTAGIRLKEVERRVGTTLGTQGNVVGGVFMSVCMAIFSLVGQLGGEENEEAR